MKLCVLIHSIVEIEKNYIPNYMRRRWRGLLGSLKFSVIRYSLREEEEGTLLECRGLTYLSN